MDFIGIPDETSESVGRRIGGIPDVSSEFPLFFIGISDVLTVIPLFFIGNSVGTSGVPLKRRNYRCKTTEIRMF